MTMMAFLHNLSRNASGTMVVETAIVAPVLAMMALGAYDVAKLVQRQQELQSAASEAEIIAMATESGATADPQKVDDILTVSMGFNPDTDAGKVVVTGKYLCDAGTTPVDTAAACDVDPDVTEIATPYYHIQISDTYTPMWTSFGVGHAVSMSVDRWVLVPPSS
jgi:Flp pilus assembly protein TadG